MSFCFLAVCPSVQTKETIGSKNQPEEVLLFEKNSFCLRFCRNVIPHRNDLFEQGNGKGKGIETGKGKGKWKGNVFLQI